MLIKILSNVKEILTIGSLAAAMFFGYMNQKNKERANDAENNLYSKTIQWEDEKGRLVTETTELRYSVKDLKAISERDSADLSVAEKVIWEAGKTIEALKVKPQHVISYSEAEVEAIYDSLVTTPTLESGVLTAIDPINTKHLKIKFVIEGDRIIAKASYKAKIKTVVDRSRRKITYKGNARFFLVRWLSPDWQYTSKTVCDDPNAKISSSVQINFNNRK